MLPRRFRPRPGSRWLLRAPRTPSPAGLVLTVRVWQLSHSRHEGLLGHVAARALLHEGLLVRAVQLLGELDGLQGCQAAGHTVDDGDALCLGCVEALCNGHDSREGGHDEVLRLLGIMVGQAVDVRQGADRGQPTS